MPQASPQAEIESLQSRIQRLRQAHQSTRNEEARLRELRTKQLRREVRAMKRKAR
jgi:prefoldin subunit 5